MATETSESLDHLRRCAIDGCAWRGLCPDHDIDVHIDADLNRLMRLRPFGAGRKHQRSAAHYAQSHRGKFAVTVTTIEERRKNPPVTVRRKRRIVHPDTLAAIRELTASLRYQRTDPSASPRTEAQQVAEERDQVSPAVEPVFVESQPDSMQEPEPVKPSPALLAHLRRPVADEPAPAPAPAPAPIALPPEVRFEEPASLLTLAGSSSSAALKSAIAAMRKARTQPKHS
ncbi:hypothetical protein SD37_09990 [Amycolatopsis orientalis]|uniref:Uncharacterized protein n=1 Tax=Amycolatopsis orientalis TaxID=31958 RepID=A0A193BUT6_AMYOR|nr:hypothetical protein [Amycolatopsis orientalis]ANN15940.1 hypothetical protein SD37_09990 [Amycolatopsis orientalis]